MEKKIKLSFGQHPCEEGLYAAVKLGHEIERILDGGEAIQPGSRLHQELTRVLDMDGLRVIIVQKREHEAYVKRTNAEADHGRNA